jgi:hypothetical protein
MDNILEKTKEKKVKIKKEVKDTNKVSKLPSSRPVEPVYNFDGFFQILLKENKSILKHHKAPIRSWVEREGLTQGTLRQFYKALEGY